MWLGAALAGTGAPVPELAGDWVRLCGDDPDVSPYRIVDDQGSNVCDFTIFRDALGEWNLIACVRGTDADGQRVFHRWTSPALRQPDWTARGIFDVPRVAGASTQAPHAVQSGGWWYLFYNTGGEARALRSADGRTWQTGGVWNQFTAPDGQPKLFAMGRDVNVFRDETRDRWQATYTGNDYAGLGAAMVARFANQLAGPWSAGEHLVKKAGNPESPFIVERDGYFFLFQQTTVYRSPRPDDFEYEPVNHLTMIWYGGKYALEMVGDESGDTVAGYSGGIYLAPIRWVERTDEETRAWRDGPYAALQAEALLHGDGNHPPRLGPVDHPTGPLDTALGPIALPIADDESPAADLRLGAVSRDRELLPPDGLSLAGTGDDRTLTIQPAPGATGAGEVLLYVLDPQGGVGFWRMTAAIAPDWPHASFTVDPDFLTENDQHRTLLTLDGSSSHDAEGPLASFLWEVPGAIYRNDTGPTDPVTQVTLPGLADLTIALTVTDSDGHTARATRRLPVIRDVTRRLVHLASDLATADAWRSTDVPKAHDPDEDQAYGTAGYWLFSPSRQALPAAVAVTLAPGISLVSGGGNVTFDDPQLPLGPAVANYQPGKLDVNQANGADLADGQESPALTLVLQADAHLVLTVISGHHPGEVARAVRLSGPLGLDSGVIELATARQYTLFELAGAAGEVFTLHATARGAQNRDSLVGLAFDVVPPAFVREDWAGWINRHAWPRPGVDDAPLADPDGDGRPNLLEFAFDGAPLLVESDSYPRLLRHDGRWVLRFPRRAHSAAGLDYFLETSPDGRVWTVEGGSWTVLQTAAERGSPADLVEAELPDPAPGDSLLVRLRIVPKQP